MTSEEVKEFLGRQRVVTCGTVGPRGWPHLMPLWYIVRAGDIWVWTYAKSQKARNLERDARATLQIEEGEQYDELRGVMIEAVTTTHRDLEQVADLGTEIYGRHGGAEQGYGFADAVRAQAGERVELQFSAARTASWDQR